MEPLLTEQSNATCCRKWGNFHNLAENANLSYYLWAWQNKSWQFSPAGTKRCCTRRLREGCALCRAKVVWMVVPTSWGHSARSLHKHHQAVLQFNAMIFCVCVFLSSSLDIMTPWFWGSGKGAATWQHLATQGFTAEAPAPATGALSFSDKYVSLQAHYC